jgi:hypothetical protein
MKTIWLCVMKTTWWKRFDEHDLMNTIWWKRLDENDLIKTIWWKRFNKNDLLRMKTIYLSTLNWADKEFFFIFLYIASLEQTWQNSSNINPRIKLRALISSTRSNINPRVGFEFLSDIQFYDQAMHDQSMNDDEFFLNNLSLLLSLSKRSRIESQSVRVLLNTGLLRIRSWLDEIRLVDFSHKKISVQ